MQNSPSLHVKLQTTCMFQIKHWVLLPLPAICCYVRMYTHYMKITAKRIHPASSKPTHFTDTLMGLCNALNQPWWGGFLWLVWGGKGVWMSAECLLNAKDCFPRQGGLVRACVCTCVCVNGCACRGDDPSSLPLFLKSLCPALSCLLIAFPSLGKSESESMSDQANWNQFTASQPVRNNMHAPLDIYKGNCSPREGSRSKPVTHGLNMRTARAKSSPWAMFNTPD